MSLQRFVVKIIFLFYTDNKKYIDITTCVKSLHKNIPQVDWTVNNQPNAPYTQQYSCKKYSIKQINKMPQLESNKWAVLPVTTVHNIKHKTVRVINPKPIPKWCYSKTIY